MASQDKLAVSVHFCHQRLIEFDMASDEQSEGQIPPGKRKRLQQMFEHGNVQLSREEHDYASDLFAQCVAGDPANRIYLDSLLNCLKRKYNNNKKGSKMATFKLPGARSGAKKAKAQEDWPGVIKAGVEALKLNPWDVTTLSYMADACNAMGVHDVQLVYLKTALDANPKDPKVNKLCAKALEDLRQFDQAIACWHRVEQARPDDEEPAQEIARLAVEKTIDKGGYEDPDRTSKSLEEAQRPQTPQAKREPVAELTTEQRLERQIERNPKDIPKYVELGELHVSRERYDLAVDVFAKALKIAGDDDDVREHWEDAQLRQMRQKYAEARKQAQESGTEKDKEQAEEVRRELNRKELEVQKNRVNRSPTNLSFRYDLGLCYQKNNMFNEAIAEYQQARNDPRRRGACMLALGQCFQRIKQYKLAMTHYESAIEEIPDRDADNRKLALYLAGRLATALKDYDVGEKHLTTLAGLDFSYRDVSTLLDKIGRFRENEGKGEGSPEAGLE
ncbi:MAG: tetratricopeptide repeat protein [Planctomycetota bacterium]|jgi:tetratricopeptide (TPR) repeat protein